MMFTSFQPLKHIWLGSLVFSYPLNTEGRYYDLYGSNLSNTDGFELDVAWSVPSLASSSVMY